MLFFPYRADIKLSRIPFLTILVCIACVFIYWQQVKNEQDLYEYSQYFCSQQKSNAHQVVMNKLAAAYGYTGKDFCSSIFLTINYTEKKSDFIHNMVLETDSFSGRSLQSTHAYIEKYMLQKTAEFNKNAPENLTNRLSYNPDSFDIVTMISSAFAHGSWAHITGNLFFFFAFAATVEAIVGMLAFPLVVIALAIGTNLVYSLTMLTAPEAIPTLGLSGVVMGVMGMFTYFVPLARIRCFFWFIIIFRKFGVPAWLLALWYFGWDVYGLIEAGNSGGVNLVAHVSGFVQGFLMGLLLFRWRKKQVQDELIKSSESSAFNRAMHG